MSKKNNSSVPVKGCKRNESLKVCFRLPAGDSSRVRKVAINGGATNVATRVVSPNQEAGYAIFRKGKEAADFTAWLKKDKHMEFVEDGFEE